MVEYDDDRPGMMRVHIAQERINGLKTMFTAEGLRQACHQRGLSMSGSKTDLAARLVEAGLTAASVMYVHEEG